MAPNWLLSRNTKKKHVGVALKARKHAKEQIMKGGQVLVTRLPSGPRVILKKGLPWSNCLAMPKNMERKLNQRNILRLKF